NIFPRSISSFDIIVIRTLYHKCDIIAVVLIMNTEVRIFTTSSNLYTENLGRMLQPS
uniref:Uncharacterized protein n=1 Tax=Macaca fascicularis TaxID=9541 RepID=A0A7N9IDB0_MACFA